MTKGEFTVLIDMDDTIENLCEAWVKWLNEKYKFMVFLDDITEWDMCKFFPDIPESEVYAPLYDEEFWKTVRPKMDAIEYIDKMDSEGYNILICTHSNIKTIRQKVEYILNRYFPSIDDNHIIILKHKQMLTADVLVDDGVHNLIGGNYKKILFTASHNKAFDAESNDMTRCNNWKEVYETITKLYEDRCTIS